MKSPKLSVIIPIYNGEEFVEQLVHNVLTQTFADFELILIDNGSKDDTAKIIKKLKTKDSRIVVISQDNSGPSSARNAGLAIAKGTFTIFIDVDDDIEPNLFEIMTQKIEDSTSDLVVAGWIIDYYHKDGRFVSQRTIHLEPDAIDPKKQDLTKYAVRSIGNDGRLYNLWNKIFKTSLIKKHQLSFREDLRFGEDLVFNLGYLKHTGRITIIGDALYHYREQSSTSLFTSSSLNFYYRQQNNLALNDFIVSKPDQELDDLAGWVKWRWFISYSLELARSQQNIRQKIKKIKKAQSEFQLKPAPSSTYIGSKKLFIEKVCQILFNIPRIYLGLMSLYNALKSARRQSNRSINLAKS